MGDAEPIAPSSAAPGDGDTDRIREQAYLDRAYELLADMATRAIGRRR